MKKECVQYFGLFNGAISESVDCLIIKSFCEDILILVLSFSLWPHLLKISVCIIVGQIFVDSTI